MKVIWDPKAKEARTQVANYIRRQFGAKRKILVSGDILYIAGFWDTRSEPEEQAKQVGK